MARRRADHIPHWKRADLLSACACLCLLSAQPAPADTFAEGLTLVSVDVGGLSSLASSYEILSGGLSDGSRYSFDRYYASDYQDIRFTMLSPVSETFGILWGFGTGERGNKYRIDPSLKIGFVLTEPITKNEWVSLSVSTVIGGYFREEACTADYGAIGGVQRVNCRMADSILPPSETLEYLENRPPEDQVFISLRYHLRF
ncbi:hypothetical protein [Ovoidimarina sediminis]|uniref:hypothetical protein n=1 Tax=Ovoidimarina sediminis TaxID=3079856 RepID=UPI002910F86C|nr:hypothetical protein [Rhodophyticola sp. MJ-SS7]MDU8945062.1 hypothetical protein [Rhodophyticola sp. MJ-SS7]